MKCKECNHTIPDGMEICNFCGCRQNELPPVEKTKKMSKLKISSSEASGFSNYAYFILIATLFFGFISIVKSINQEKKYDEYYKLIQNSYDNTMEFAQQFPFVQREVITTPNVEVSYAMLDEYVYNEKESNDTKKVYISSENSNIIIISVEDIEIYASYKDVDKMVGRNYGYDYEKDEERYSRWYVYRYSEDSAFSKKHNTPTKCTVYGYCGSDFLINIAYISERDDTSDIEEFLRYDNVRFPIN